MGVHQKALYMGWLLGKPTNKLIFPTKWEEDTHGQLGAEGNILINRMLRKAKGNDLGGDPLA